MIIIKRAYETASKDDGVRILVDRLWPRGRTKDEVVADYWLKEVAPTTELRKWFNHDPKKWKMFCKRYLHELAEKKELLEQLKTLTKKKNVTLMYGAKNEEYNQARALKEFIDKRLL